MEPSYQRRAFGLIVGGIGPFAVAGLLAPVRDARLTDDAAIVLLALGVAVAAVLGGVRSAGPAVLMAGLAFNFFFTPPFLVLHFDALRDWEPGVVLTAVAVTTCMLQTWRRWPLSPRGPARRNVSKHIDRIERQIANGVAAPELISAVRSELVTLLRLRDCWFEPISATGSGVRLPHLERDGSVSDGGADADGGPPLPSLLSLPVAAGDAHVGRFLLELDRESWPSRQSRITAVIVADHLAGVLAPRRPSTPTIARTE